jgi:peptidoglycan/xylan/chitin deacetylase (PgdA/CDA1 family)
MRKLSLIFLLVLVIGGGVFWSNRSGSGKGGIMVSQSSKFSESVQQAEIEAEAKRKAEEEARRKEEERKQKEEERKQMIATYGPCQSVPILMYHHVDDRIGSLYVRPDIFAQQMDYLVAKGYQAITLLEVVAGLQSGSLPSKPVVITLDDGYRDNYTQALPILKARNLKATIFIVTQLMDGDAYLTWDQAREMVGTGLITIGSHTLSHRSLPTLSESEAKDEIFSSKEILEAQLGLTVNAFAYPYGGANNQAIKLLREAGFTAAVVTGRHLACAGLPYTLPRIRIGNASLASYGL